MRRLAFVLALFCASPLAAQDRMTPEQCVASWNALLDIAPMFAQADEVISDRDGWCQISGPRIDLETRTSAKAERIRWRATDIARFIENGLPPRGLEVRITDLRMVPQIGDPVMDYLLELQSIGGGMDVAFSVRWDGLQKAILVDQASVVFSDGNDLSLTARLDGVDLTDVATMQTSIGSAGLSDFSARANFDGWFEVLLALPLGTILLDQSAAEPPAAQVEDWKMRGQDFVAGLPDEVLAPASREALTAFFGVMPSPRGTLRVQFSSDPPYGSARAVPLMAMSPDTEAEDVLATLLDGVDLLFTWTPEGGQ